jgi:hypothetical protein
MLTASGKGGLVVIPMEPAKQKINNFGSSVLAPSAILTIATYTVPALKRFIFAGGTVGGSKAGEFQFIINSGTQCLVRNSGSSRTVQLVFLEPPEASAGSVIEIKAKNIDNTAGSFEALLSGHIVDV